MIDEEIEKAIELCESENLPCQECAYWKISLQGNNCRNVLIRDMHDYINRIKAENAKLKAVDNRVAFCNAYDHLQADYKRLIKEKQQVRKDTAKEILQEVEMHSICRLRADGYKEYTISELTLNEISDKYVGLETDDE